LSGEIAHVPTKVEVTSHQTPLVAREIEKKGHCRRYPYC